MSIDRLQSDVAAHDSEGWRHSPGRKTDEHNHLHAGKTLGKIAGHLEAIQDGELPEGQPLDPKLVADLAIEAIRFANNGGFNLTEAIDERLAELRERNRERNSKS